MEIGKRISGCSCTVKSCRAPLRRDRSSALCRTETILRRKTVQLSWRQQRRRLDDDDNSDWMLVGNIAGLMSTGLLRKGGSLSKLSHEHQELYSSRTKKVKIYKKTNKKHVRPVWVKKRKKISHIGQQSSPSPKQETNIHACKQIETNKHACMLAHVCIHACKQIEINKPTEKGNWLLMNKNKVKFVLKDMKLICLFCTLRRHGWFLSTDCAARLERSGTPRSGHELGQGGVSVPER